MPKLDPVGQQQMIGEIATGLRSGIIRLDVLWATAEPNRGDYNEAYLDGVVTACETAAAMKLKVLVTVQNAPVWAQDSALWSNPPSGYPRGEPQPFYAVDRDHLIDLRSFMAELASRLGPSVFAYECWNEPNLWPYIYPQRTTDDEYFAPRLYLAMLKAFRNGLQDAGSTARVVAGATAPIGLNDKYRTSPQKFARFLKDAGAAEYFDAYSHHPYTPGGSRNTAPDQPPNDPTTTVTLYNLKQLLNLFPGKPFYLTEYGYNTKPCVGFGGFTATPVQQATYLKKAYAYAGRYSQVKMLIWYMVQDFQYGEDPEEGVYSGLRNVDGSRKLSWFAFAGGNRVSIDAPAFARIGTSVRVRGTVTNASIGAVNSRTLVLQARKTSGGSWSTLKSTRTDGDGKYRFYVKASSSRVYRVVWRGVRTSATRTVRVY